jgi:hypothetical protein
MTTKGTEWHFILLLKKYAYLDATIYFWQNVPRVSIILGVRETYIPGVSICGCFKNPAFCAQRYFVPCGL